MELDADMAKQPGKVQAVSSLQGSILKDLLGCLFINHCSCLS